MEQQSVILNFPKTIVELSLTSKIIKKYDIDVNILQARINVEQEGYIFANLQGEKSKIQEALDYLKNNGVSIIIPHKNLIINESLCVNCGACIAHCMVGALAFDDNHKVNVDLDKCIACERCVPPCSFGAMESISSYLEKRQ